MITPADLPQPGDEPISPPPPQHEPAPRFVCDKLPDAPGQAVTLDPDQAKHAIRVLRLAPGDKAQLLDGRGRIAQATLTDVGPKSASFTIDAIDRRDPPKPAIELATAIPKGPRGDAMINDLAQLGVDRLIPLTTQRSIVNPRPTKLERFHKAAMEAAKQSGRAWFMDIAPTLAFADALDCDAQLKLVADPYAQPIADLPARLASAHTVRVLIGPEGGLTEQEIDSAGRAGFEPWRFSPHVLRIETAAAAAVAVLRHPA